MNMPLKGSIQIGNSASAHVHIWMEENIRIVKIISCILTSIVVSIYAGYFNTNIPLIAWGSVCVVLLLSILDALSPKNKVIDTLLKIPKNWLDLLTIITTLNFVLPIDIPLPIRYITYLLSFFWITFRIQQWFDKELKNPNAIFYKRLSIIVINILFVIGFVCFCLIIGMKVSA